MKIKRVVLEAELSPYLEGVVRVRLAAWTNDNRFTAEEYIHENMFESLFDRLVDGLKAKVKQLVAEEAAKPSVVDAQSR